MESYKDERKVRTIPWYRHGASERKKQSGDSPRRNTPPPTGETTGEYTRDYAQNPGHLDYTEPGGVDSHILPPERKLGFLAEALALVMSKD